MDSNHHASRHRPSTCCVYHSATRASSLITDYGCNSNLILLTCQSPFFTLSRLTLPLLSAYQPAYSSSHILLTRSPHITPLACLPNPCYTKYNRNIGNLPSTHFPSTRLSSHSHLPEPRTLQLSFSYQYPPHTIYLVHSKGQPP